VTGNGGEGRNRDESKEHAERDVAPGAGIHRLTLSQTPALDDFVGRGGGSH